MRVPRHFGVRPDFSEVVKDVPQLARGQVWCRTCGYTQEVDSARCLAEGWPKHCGQTMTIDAPGERPSHKGKTR